MVTNLATAAPALVSPGLDLELSFTQALQGLGLSPQIAHLIWLPLPMALVLVALVLVYSNSPSALVVEAEDLYVSAYFAELSVVHPPLCLFCLLPF